MCTGVYGKITDSVCGRIYVSKLSTLRKETYAVTYATRHGDGHKALSTTRRCIRRDPRDLTIYSDSGDRVLWWLAGDIKTCLFAVNINEDENFLFFLRVIPWKSMHNSHSKTYWTMVRLSDLYRTFYTVSECLKINFGTVR